MPAVVLKLSISQLGIENDFEVHPEDCEDWADTAAAAAKRRDRTSIVLGRDRRHDPEAC